MYAAGGIVQIPGHAAVRAVEIPRLAGADVAVELQRAVLGQDAHGVNAGIGAVGQGKVDDAILAAKCHGGLGHLACEHVQAASLAACQQHGDTFFFHVFSSSFASFASFTLALTV